MITVLNAYSKDYPFITNRLRASVWLQTDPQTFVAEIIEKAPHFERTWHFPGLPTDNYGFRLDEIDNAGVVIFNLAKFDVVPSEVDTTAYGKASVAEINVGVNDEKFPTPLGLEGSKYISQNGTKIKAAATGTGTYIATIAPAITSYVAGQNFYITFSSTNTGAATLNLNNLGAKSIKKAGNTALIAGDIVAGQVTPVHYDGTNFQLLGVGGSFIAKVDGAITTEMIESNIAESIAEAQVAFGHATSTFTGWGTQMGAQKNFNTLKFRIRARAGNATPITKVRVWVTETNKTGTVLGDVMITGLSIAASADQYLVATFPATITNGGNIPLYFFYKSDQISDQYAKSTTGTIEYYTTTANIDTTNPAAFTNGVGFSINWCRVSLITQAIVPTQGFKDQILKDVNPPSPAYADSIATTSPILKANAFLVNSAMTLGYIDSNLVELFPESSASFQYASSTFSGWGATIGIQKNFNSIVFKFRARAGNANPITRVRCWVTSVDKNGTVLGDVIVTGLSVVAGAVQEVRAIFPTTIANSSDQNLLFLYKCDQLSDVYCVLNGDIKNVKESYTTTATNMDTTTPANFIVASGSSIMNTWCKISMAVQGAIPTELFVDQIEDMLNISTDSAALSAMVKAEIVLPLNIYCIEGRETNIWFFDIIFSNLRWEQFDYDITCNKGSQLYRGWRYLPIATDAGTVTLTLDVYFEGVLVKTASTTINTVAQSVGSGIVRNVLCVGDSTTNGGNYISPITSENAGDVMTLNFKGTLGTGLNKHEGRSGWRMSDYATAGRPNYIFNVTGVVTPPGIGAIYSDGSSTYTVIEVNITAGNGYFSCTLTTGSGTPPATGTMTKTSGLGQASIPYSSTSVQGANPFWNGTAVSLTYYLTQTGITLASGDWISIALGINDIFGSTAATIDSAVDTYITQMRSFVSAMHAGVSGIRVGIWVLIMPTISQDAFGINYTSGQALFQYLRNVKKLQQRMITEFDTAAEKTALNFLLPMNCVIDRENSFPKATVGASKRETVNTVTQWQNGVHPATSGYQQLSDQFWAFLKKLI